MKKYHFFSISIDDVGHVTALEKQKLENTTKEPISTCNTQKSSCK